MDHHKLTAVHTIKPQEIPSKNQNCEGVSNQHKVIGSR